MRKIAIRLRLRRSFSESLLNFVSKLPRFQGGWIARLQEVRERQVEERKEFREALNLSLSKSRLSHAHFAEIYFVEDLNVLKRQLRQMFPDDPYEFKHQLEPLKNEDRMSALSWQIVGTMSRKGGYSPFRTATIKNLPEEIQSINVELHHLMPSVWVLSFAVVLDKNASKPLQDIIQNPPLATVTLASWWPVKKWGWMHSTNGPENAARVAAADYQNRLLRSCSSSITRHFKGFFARSRGYLPSVLQLEVTFKAVNDDVKRKHRWGDLRSVFRLEALDWSGFVSDKNRILLWTDDYPPRLISFDDDEDVTDDELRMRSEAGKALSAQLVLFEFSMVVEKWLVRKRALFFSVWRKPERSKALMDAFSLVREGAAYAFALERVLVEWAQTPGALRHMYVDLNSFGSVKDNPEGRDGLQIQIEKWTKSQLRDNQKYLKLLLRLGEQEVANRNARLMFLLQRRIYWFTLAAVIIAICSMLGFDKVRDALHLVQRTLTSLHVRR